MSLTDTAIRNAKPKETPYKMFDGGGLFLLVAPQGSKLWRLKFRVLGKEKLLSLGVYPEISLKEARERRDQNCGQILRYAIVTGRAKRDCSADFRGALSAERMKMRQPHLVSLSTQAIKIFEELQPLTGKGKYVFPSALATRQIS